MVLLTQFAWIGLLLSWILFHEKPDWMQLFSAVLIMGGTILASGVTVQEHLQISLRGVLLALLSAAIYAIYIVANGNVASRMDMMKKSAIIMTGSAIGIFLVNSNELNVTRLIDIDLLKWTLFLSFFGTIIPPVLFAKGIPKIGAGISSLIMTVELPVAVLFAHIVLKEQLDPAQWLGVTVMLFALFLLNARKGGMFKDGLRKIIKGQAQGK